jgi:bile acid:Na+ symporter, BASS family
MDLATLIPLGLKASVAIMVFGLGLSSTFDDTVYLFRRPSEFVRSLLAMAIVMPLVATLLAALFDLHQAVKIALIALAISPVPPLLPKKQRKAGGRASYAVGLLVAAALLSIVFVPVAVEVLGRGFGTNTHHISFLAVARLAMMAVLGPLLTGLLFRSIAPAIAERIVRPISLIATVLLFACALAVLVSAWQPIVSLIGNGTIVALAAFVVIGLMTGHLLGGPDPEDRSVLALATAARHPGVALAIASANFPEQKLASAAILLYLVLSAILTIPYVMWRKRHAEISDTIATAKES